MGNCLCRTTSKGLLERLKLPGLAHRINWAIVFSYTKPLHHCLWSGMMSGCYMEFTVVDQLHRPLPGRLMQKSCDNLWQSMWRWLLSGGLQAAEYVPVWIHWFGTTQSLKLPAPFSSQDKIGFKTFCSIKTFTWHVFLWYAIFSHVGSKVEILPFCFYVYWWSFMTLLKMAFWQEVWSFVLNCWIMRIDERKENLLCCAFPYRGKSSLLNWTRILPSELKCLSSSPYLCWSFKTY